MKCTRAALTILAGLASLAVIPIVSSAQNLPSVQIVRELTLTTPSAANGLYDTATAHTQSFPSPPHKEIQALAHALGKTRLGVNGFTVDDYIERAFLYVRNNVEVVPIFGMQKGSIGALIDQSGTAFDQTALFVELLREGGVNVQYQLGTINLSGQQFQDWYGPGTPRAACELLAGGAIPATVNGLTNCETLSNTVSPNYTVQMMHVWALANGNVYDPSYKTYVHHAGIDLGAAIGCDANCDDQAISSLITNVTANTASGFKLGDFYTKLNDFSIELLRYLVDDANGLSDKSTKEVFGGREIDLEGQLAADASLPYSLNVLRSWPGDVPDAFRVKLDIQYRSIDVSYYADDIFGKDMIVYPSTLSRHELEYSNATPYLSIGGKLLGGFGPYSLLDENDPNFLSIDRLDIEISRPYLNHSYASETVTKFPGGAGSSVEFGGELANYFFRFRPFAIIQSWGHTDQNSEAFSAKPARDAAIFYTASEKEVCDATNRTSDGVTGGSYYACGQRVSFNGSRWLLSSGRQLPGFLNKWAAEASSLMRLQENLSDTLIQHHGSIGYAKSADFGGNSISVSGSLFSGSFSTTSFSTTELDIETRLTTLSLGGSNTVQEATNFVTSALMSAFESGAPRRANRMPNLVTSGINFLQTAAICDVDLRAFSAGQSASGLVGTYNQPRIDLINQYLADGFDVIVPYDDFVARCLGAPSADPLLMQSPLIAYRPDGTAVTFASTVADSNYAIVRKGGGGGGPPMFGDLGIPQSVKEVDHAARARLTLPDIDLASGRLQLTAEPDIVTGAGAFPYSLPLVRNYDSTRQSGAAIGDNNGLSINISAGGGHPNTGGGARTGGAQIRGLGWTHNYDIKVTAISDAHLGMGSQSPINAVEAVATLYVANELIKSGKSLDRQATLAHSAIWLNTKLFENAVSVNNAGSSTTYARLPSDACLDPSDPSRLTVVGGDKCFSAPPGSFATLKQFGSGQSRELNTRTGRPYVWETFSVSYELLLANGQQMRFGQSATEQEIEQYKPIESWSFPGGAELTFCYTAGADCSVFDELVTGDASYPQVNGGYKGTQLFRVENNLGRYLAFDYGVLGIGSVDLIVSDDAGRSVVYGFQTVESETSPSADGGTYSQVERVLTTVTDPEGHVTRYTYTNSDWRLIIATPNAYVDEFNVYLSEIYTPSDDVNPFLQIEYDPLWRPIRTTNATGLVTDYHPLTLGTEKWRFGESIVNLSATEKIVSQMWFNRTGQPVVDISPVGERTERRYNGRNELTEIIYPEGNRLTAQYDLKGNVTEIINHPKPDSSDAPITSSAAYHPVWNGPTQLVDGMGGVTDVTYNAQGLPETVTEPAGLDGVRPVSNYTYNTIGHLMEAANGEGEATCYTYDANSKYDPTEERLSCQTGGLGFVTGLTVDAVGNISAVDGPRTDVADTSDVVFDDLRRPIIVTGADPDGSGLARAPVSVNVYDADGLLIKTCTLAEDMALPSDPVASCAASTAGGVEQ